MTTLIISNDETDDKNLEHSRLLIKGINETIKDEGKVQIFGFLGMLLSTLVASLLGNMFPGKGVIKAGEGTINAVQDF